MTRKKHLRLNKGIPEITVMKLIYESIQTLKHNTAVAAAKAKQPISKKQYSCYFCNQPIWFSQEYASPATGKKIPMQLGLTHPHCCPDREVSNNLKEGMRTGKYYDSQKPYTIGGKRIASSYYEPKSNFHRCYYCGSPITFDSYSRNEARRHIPLEIGSLQFHNCISRYQKRKK